jgi:hypothetical protein
MQPTNRGCRSPVGCECWIVQIDSHSSPRASRRPTNFTNLTDFRGTNLCEVDLSFAVAIGFPCQQSGTMRGGTPSTDL